MLELTCFVFEVPTGVVADAYSRKLSIVIGMVLIGLGFMLEGLFPRFELILLAQVVWGIGATEVVRRRVDTNSHAIVARVLSINSALLIALVVVFGLTGHWGVAFTAFIATRPLR